MKRWPDEAQEKQRNTNPKGKRHVNIGIIGAGNIGGALTRRFTVLGHKVFVANSRGPETLADLAAETGAKSVTVEEAAQSGDVVVVTIPEKNILELPAGLFAKTAENVVVVDTGNYYPQQRDGRIDEIENGMPESRWVEKELGRPVVKAFNNITAGSLGTRGGLEQYSRRQLREQGDASWGGGADRPSGGR